MGLMICLAGFPLLFLLFAFPFAGSCPLIFPSFPLDVPFSQYAAVRISPRSSPKLRGISPNSSPKLRSGCTRFSPYDVPHFPLISPLACVM